MAPLYDGHDYYKRMFELQEKLRKSEKERIRLEERFNVLARESRNRHDTCINRLRMRYIQYLEEQRTRDERNHMLLAALDKVTNKLALISAKKDRLNVLRKQYEAYLLRVYANRRPPGSVTGDSGIASQNEDRCPRKSAAAARLDLVAAETRGVSSPRAHQAPPQSGQSRSSPASKFHDQSPVNDILLNNSALLPMTLDASPVDYHHQASVLRSPRVYVSPVNQSDDQLAQVPAILTPNACQYSRTISDYGGNAPGSLQVVTNPHASHPTAPLLSMPSLSGQIQSDAALINQLLKQHMESVQAAPGLTTNEAAHPHIPQQLDPLTFVQPFEYHHANILHSNQQAQMREYVPSRGSDSTVARAASVTAKLNAYPTSIIPEMNVVNQAGPLPGYMDYILRSPHKSEDEGSTRSLTSDDVDDLIKRNEHLMWRNADVAKSSRRLSTALAVSNANLDENGKTTAILENELDRYISNIRKLHREHGVQSQEELDHEQNTSGDLLNVTLSEDAQDLPAEDKAKKERVPQEMDRILALASDLVSRTADSREIAGLAERDHSDVPAKQGEDEGKQGADKERDALIKESAEKRDAAAVTMRNEIREDVAPHSTKLERPREDTKTVRERNNDDLAESQVRDQEMPIAKGDDAREEATVSSSSGLPVDDPSNLPAEEKQLDLFTGEELDIDDIFDIAEELPLWDLASVQKSVRNLCLDDSDNERALEQQAREAANGEVDDTIADESSHAIEQNSADGEGRDSHLSRDVLPPAETEAKRSSENETESREKRATGASHVEGTESSVISNGDQHGETNELAAHQIDEKLNEVETRSRMRDDQAGTIAKQNDEYNVETEYAEKDPSQVQRYQEQQEPHGQYDYGQGMPYEGASNEEYERYAEQGYAQEGQGYVEYVEGQYEQYVEDSNGQQQYQHDSNAQYQQDPNQAYDYSYDQQYDPGQGYEGDPNQAYEYPENVPYDPNQPYDGAYEQEYKREQQSSEGNVVTVDSAREGAGSETEEASSRKTDDGEDKTRQTDGVDAKDQSKKKKDVIKSLLDSDTDTTTIERNVSNTESDFDFN